LKGCIEREKLKDRISGSNTDDEEFRGSGNRNMVFLLRLLSQIGFQKQNRLQDFTQRDLSNLQRKVNVVPYEDVRVKTKGISDLVFRKKREKFLL